MVDARETRVLHNARMTAVFGTMFMVCRSQGRWHRGLIGLCEAYVGGREDGSRAAFRFFLNFFLRNGDRFARETIPRDGAGCSDRGGTLRDKAENSAAPACSNAFHFFFPPPLRLLKRKTIVLKTIIAIRVLVSFGSGNKKRKKKTKRGTGTNDDVVLNFCREKIRFLYFDSSSLRGIFTRETVFQTYFTIEQ